jgi:hypothetical protein
MEPLKFDDFKEKIANALNSRIKSLNSPIIDESAVAESGYILIEGFFNLGFQKELSGGLILGGPTLPSVAVVGNTSGRIYFFALKALLPDISLP